MCRDVVLLRYVGGMFRMGWWNDEGGCCGVDVLV